MKRKGWFYWIFLIASGSLFITCHRHLALYLAPHRMAPAENFHLERPYAKDSLDLVAEWRMVLEGMDGQSIPKGSNLTTAAAAADGVRKRGAQLDAKDSYNDDLSDEPQGDGDESHKVNRHFMDKELEQSDGGRNEPKQFSDDCGLASCVTTALDTENSSQHPSHVVQLPPSLNQSQALQFSVESTACIRDLSMLPNMAEIYTEPKLNLSPSFNSSVTEYYATVDHDLIVIQIKGFSANCQTEVRLADRYGPSGLSNYTLSLGLNRVPLVVVDLMHSEPWIVNTYTLNIYRLPPGDLQRNFDASKPHQVCYLIQDCGLSFLANEKCGLQPDNRYLHWESFESFVSRLVPCNSGTAPGRWVLPCGDCGRRETCFWLKVTWQPFNCTHFPLARHRLRHCLQGKKILFVGDSTNRGMMHYMMEQINGSLMESDKTHDSKVYTNINDNQTMLSFTYYPQFWLPMNQRPLFDESLYQLIEMSRPLAGDPRQTVLVVGGVHWMGSQHLDIISTVLQQSGLLKIKVIVKTLGAGFHLHVDGLHHLTLVEQRRLVLHNSLLMDRARSLGFDVVETFNMTMARYKDFLQGKCACHFHRVKAVLPSFMKFLRHSTLNGRWKLVDMPFQYHVEGEVNAIYSEILLNRICDAG